MAKVSRTLIRNGTIVTMNSHREVLRGDILVENNKIKKIAKRIAPPTGAKVVDASDMFVIPGLVQAHTHLCQTLMRGEADDMVLLQWLKTAIWPMESHHDSKSIRASAALTILEMQKLGTTSILDMATVHHTNDLLEEVSESGLRYWGGKCLMDDKVRSGPLYEETRLALRETESLIKTWSGKNDLVQFALCPRFAVSCTREILEACADLQKKYDLLIHTHASESVEEIELVRKLTGFGNIEYFQTLGILNPKMVLVHGVHVGEKELEFMVAAKTKLVHCPSSNLKLASGIAPTEHYRRAGLVMGIGADGAPCNNMMDPFMEMRLMALLQKPEFGCEAMSAESAFAAATIGGARVLSAETQIGSLEVDKLADIVLVDRRTPGVVTVENPYSALVYSCSGRDVHSVMVNGSWVVKNRKSLVYDEDEVMDRALTEKKKLQKRMGLRAH